MVDAEEKSVGLHEYVRSVSNNPQKEIMTYVGKKTVYTNANLNIVDNHKSRTNSTLVTLRGSGEKEAYEIARHIHDTKNEMEPEESFYQVT